MARKAALTLCDTHAHLDFKRFASDFDDVLVHARRNGVQFIVTVGAGRGWESNQEASRIASDHEWIWATAGWHPHNASKLTGDLFMKVRSLAFESQVVAIGEAGLDYHYDKSPRADQREVFLQQVYLAREVRKPIVVHSREAEVDTIDILKRGGARETGGIIHCFSGTQWLARQALDLGFYLSFSGIVTFPDAALVQKVAKWVPADRILIETDAPYLAPVPHRGRRNEPAYVEYVLRKLAELRGVPAAEMAERVLDNARRAFRIA